MNINFGLIDSTDMKLKLKGREKKAFQSKKALKDFDIWIKNI